MNSEKTNVLVQFMKQNRNMIVSNCYNFATEIRKDSDWDKKVRGGLESQTCKNSLNHLTTLFKSFHN